MGKVVWGNLSEEESRESRREWERAGSKVSVCLQMGGRPARWEESRDDRRGEIKRGQLGRV